MLSSVALRRRMLVSLEINNKDPAYEWFLSWMSHEAAKPATKKSRLVAALSRSHQLSVQTAYEQRKNGSASALFSLVAGPGTHYLNYKKAWIQVSLPYYSCRP